MYRDFSEQSKKKLLELVDQVENEKWCNFTDWIGDRWYDFEDWIGILDIRNYLDDVNAYHKKVLDKNNVGRDVIENIFQNVRDTDCLYGLYLRDKFAQLTLMRVMLEDAGMIIRPENGAFSTDIMAEKMGEIWERYVTLLTSPSRPENQIPNIMGFDVTAVFLDNRSAVEDGMVMIYSADWLKNLLGSIGLGDNITEGAIRTSLEMLLKQLLVNKHAGSDFFDDAVEQLLPEELETVKKLIQYILKGGKLYNELQIAEILNIDVKDLSESDFLKWFCSKENLKIFESLADKFEQIFGSYGDAIELIDTLATLIGKAINDYSEDIRILEQIKQAILNSEFQHQTTLEVIDQLIDEYSNGWRTAFFDGLGELLDKVLDSGPDILIELSKKKGFSILNGVGGAWNLLNFFLITKDLTASITGLEDRAEMLQIIYSTQLYSYSLVEMYNSLCDKIGTGNYTNEDVIQAQQYFEMAKEAKLQEYRICRNITQGVLDGALFESAEDKQETLNVLAKIDQEISRLEDLSFPVSMYRRKGGGFR